MEVPVTAVAGRPGVGRVLKFHTHSISSIVHPHASRPPAPQAAHAPRPRGARRRARDARAEGQSHAGHKKEQGAADEYEESDGGYRCDRLRELGIDTRKALERLERAAADAGVEYRRVEELSQLCER